MHYIEQIYDEVNYNQPLDDFLAEVLDMRADAYEEGFRNMHIEIMEDEEGGYICLLVGDVPELEMNEKLPLE